MSGAADDPNDDSALRSRLVRLERRVERERAARLEAERIAEDGMRELYLANRDLDQRILERTRQLDEALQAAHAASRAKSAFLAHMSHHLMTPLNGVVGMLELLGNADFEDHQAAWHESAVRSARRLDRLVRQLLAFVEVDGVDLRRSAPIRPLIDVLETIEARWHQPMLRAGQLPMFDLSSADQLWVAAPPELSTLFDELFSNVVEHAGPGPVSLRVRRVDDTRIAVDVADPGPGIDQETREMASSLGVRADLERQGDGSAPLGLVLMQRIATGIDGRLVIADATPCTVSVELQSERQPATS